MKKYENYKSHLKVLNKAYQEDLNNEFIISGVIDKFFIQFELGWKVLKELLNYEGRREAQSGSPREIIKTAYACFDFVEEDVWLEMLRQRNNMAHIYDKGAAKDLVDLILEQFIPAFGKLGDAIEEQYGGKKYGKET